MDIRVLQYFLAVSREESITKAAEALRMTQPPLSRQLKDLEAEELVDLMERQKRSWLLPTKTSTGKFILAAGKQKQFLFSHRQPRIYKENIR